MAVPAANAGGAPAGTVAKSPQGPCWNIHLKSLPLLVQDHLIPSANAVRLVDRQLGLDRIAIASRLVSSRSPSLGLLGPLFELATILLVLLLVFWYLLALALSGSACIGQALAMAFVKA